MGSLQSLDWNGGMEWWNGMVEWKWNVFYGVHAVFHKSDSSWTMFVVALMQCPLYKEGTAYTL